MPKTLLLADDSITIQKVVGICLANEDVSIVNVDNGEDAIIKARALRPDLVVADVVMPRRNGYEVCLSIRQDPELKHIPVILLAGAFEAFDEKRYREVLANSYIIKPFESQTLIAAVRKLLYPEQVQPVVPQPPQFRPPVMPPGMTPPPARPTAPEMPMVPPHMPAPRPTSSPVRPMMPPTMAPRPPSSPSIALTPPPMAAPPPQVAPVAPPAPRPAPAAPIPSFEAALGAAPAAKPPEMPKPPSSDVAMVDEISAADIEEIASSSVVEAVTPPSEPPKPAAAPIPEAWAGIEIKQVVPEPKMEVEHTAMAAAAQTPVAGIEQWGIELKQELAEAAAPPPQILTAAESAQEIPVAPAPVAPPIEEKAPPMQPVSAGEMSELVKKSIREIVERVAWEVVPELAETIIREELKRLLAEEDKK